MLQSSPDQAGADRIDQPREYDRQKLMASSRSIDVNLKGGVSSSLVQQASPALGRRGDHAMTSNGTTPCLPQSETETAVPLFDSWFDPIEAGLRDRDRDFLQAMFEGELDVLLSGPPYGR